MYDDFDPYAAWLGIRETTRPLSHYQLLGLAEFEENPLAVSIAADAAVTRLKGADPGNRRGRWQQTMDEVVLAKLCLTNRTRKIQYDSTLRERRGVVAPVTSPSAIPVPAMATQKASGPAPGSDSADMNPPTLPPTIPPQTTSAPIVPPATVAYSMPQQVTFAQPIYVAVPAAQPFMPPVGTPMGYSVPMGSPMPGYAPAPMPVPRAVPVVPSVSAPVAYDQPYSTEIAPSPFEEIADHELSAPVEVSIAATPIGQQTSPAFELESAPRRSPARKSADFAAPDPKFWGTVAAVALVLLLAFVVFKSLSHPEKQIAGVASSEVSHVEPASATSRPTQSKVDPAAAAHPKIEDAPPKPAVSKPLPAEPAKRPEPPQPQAVAMTQIELPDGEPTPETQSKPDPQPQSEPPAQTPEQKAAFENAIRNARAALGARKLPVARQELKTAKANVGLTEQETQLARMEELYGYVEGFWKAVLESMKGLQATDTLPIDNTEIAIVEVDGESLTIRAAGRNLSYTLETMPSGLALALAKRWFKAGEAANDIYLGAFHAVDPQGNLNEARRCWEAATRGGANADSLMPLLEERTQALVTEQQPVPKKAMLAKMKTALRRSMPDEFRMAKSLEQKLSLARQLLDAAVQNDDPIQRYTLYEEALSLAVAAGSVVDMNTALDGLIAGYKVDAWSLRADAFHQAADSANNPVIAKAMAQDMIEIVDRALAEKQPAAALKLCNALLSVAKKGKDLELVRLANERKSKLAELGQ